MSVVAARSAVLLHPADAVGVNRSGSARAKLRQGWARARARAEPEQGSAEGSAYLY